MARPLRKKPKDLLVMSCVRNRGGWRLTPSFPLLPRRAWILAQLRAAYVLSAAVGTLNLAQQELGNHLLLFEPPKHQHKESGSR